MKRFLTLQKAIGETPLAALSAWKKVNPAYKDTRASYAGRLDPMASGKLLVLLGDECKKQKEYAKLDKEYEVEVLVDVGSDTGDALGIISSSGTKTRPDDAALRAALRREEGAHIRQYPAYSSKTVNGKPLFLYALEGTLGSIEIPEHKEHIYRIRLLGREEISCGVLRARIETLLAKVPKTDEPAKALGADFRIDAVRASWKKVFEQERDYALVKLRVACGSGTYMRSLAGRIGEVLSTKALALSIHRTKIGKYWNGFWFWQA